MRSLIKMEMTRYPVFEVVPPTDLPFNDLNARKNGAATHHSSRNSQLKNTPKSDNLSEDKHERDVNSSRCSRKKNSIQKYINDLTQELVDPRQEPDLGDSKFKVLQRIIEHYDIKNMEKKNYSKLIQTFGLQIGSAKTTEKSINTSEQKRRNFSIKPTTTRANSRLRNTIQEHSEVALLEFSSQMLPVHKGGQLLPAHKRGLPTANSSRLGSSLLEKKRLKIQIHKKSTTNEKHNKINPLKFSSKLDVIVEKLNKYRQFLFALNFSNDLYRDLQIHSYEKPIKYFIGPGNNSNLIKSLLKKRHYFQETFKVSEANFVWSQIKIQPVFQKQNTTIFSNDLKRLRDSHSPVKQKRTVLVNSRKLTNNFEENLKKILARSDADEIMAIQQEQARKNFTSSFGERIRMHGKRVKMSEHNQRDVVHNHLPSNGLLGNKKGMFYCMRQYYKLTSRNIWEVLPLTFHVTKGVMDPQFKQFQHYYQERKKNKYQNCWVMKPGEFSNRGNGINCSNKFEEIKKRVMNCQSGRNGKNAKTVILQLYITNPLLYNNRKFDIRTFMLVSCHNGKIKGYWYQQGYIRTSSFLFNLAEITDNDIHLTNDAIQKQSDSYGKFEPGNKLSYQQLQRYLDTLPLNGRNLDLQACLVPKMKKIATQALMSSFLFLDQNRRQNNFQIFGLDFMIDYHFNPWLIEINTNPCLELSCPLLERIIPHMVENAFRIGLDTIFPPPEVVPHNYKYTIAENALHYNRFELIFDETRDGGSVKALYEESPTVAETISGLMNIQEDQEIFEEEGILCDYDI